MTFRPFHEIGEKLAGPWGCDDKDDLSAIIKSMPADQRTYCLLATIVNLLQKPENKTDSERLQQHSIYLTYHWDRDTAVIRSINKELIRIVILCGGNAVIYRCCEVIDTDNAIHRLSYLYSAPEYSDHHEFFHYRLRLANLLKKLKSIKQIDDLMQFHGIGKVKIKKLKEQIEQQRRDK